MSDVAPTDVGSFADWDRIDKVCDRFEAALRAQERPALEVFLQGMDPALRPRLLLELLALELTYQVRQGETYSDDQVLAAHPALRLELIPLLAELKATGADPRAAGHTTPATERAPRAALIIRCPQCHEPNEVGGAALEVVCPVCGASFEVVEGGTLAAPPLQSIGHFDLIGYLGAGTFGTVWKARDTRLHRIVAVKIPRSSLVAAEGPGRFLHEARAAAQLNHPNIVPVHEVGLEGGEVYIVQDLVRGAPLSDWIRDRRLTFAEAVRICVGIAAGLQHAHERGVVHRDIKPANVMLDHEGQPRITDFGLAKRDAVEATVSLDGQVLGTPAYMAPEQAQGDAKLCDARTDLYALGVVLFQMLTGELPFRGNARMLIHQLVHQEPPRLRKLNGRVPKDLETICLKCLEKEPRKRYSSARELSEDLRRYERGEPIAARPVTAAGRLLRWARREPVTATLVGALAVIVGAAGLGFAALGAKYVRNRADLQASQVVEAIQQAQAERTVRIEGYWPRAWRHLERALSLGPGLVDRDELRQEAAGLLGDFVGNEPLDIDCSQYPGGATAVALQPAGKHLAVGFQDGAVRLFNPQHGEADAATLAPAAAAIVALAFDSVDRVIGLDEQGGLYQWPLGGVSEGAVTPTKVSSLVVQGDGKANYDLTNDGRFALAWRQAHVVLVDVNDPKSFQTFSGAPAGAEVRNAAYCPEAALLVASYSQSPAHGLVCWRTSAPDTSATVSTRVGYGYPHSLAIGQPSSSGGLVAVGGDDGMAIYSYEPGSLQLTPRSYARTDTIKALAFTADGSYLATHEIRGRIELIRPATGRPTASLVMERSTGNVQNDLAFSADGQFAASCSGTTARVWSLRTAERVRPQGHDAAVPCLLFAPDSRTLLSASKDGRVCFWDPRSGREARPALQLGAQVQAMAISPDGRTLATGIWSQDAAPIRLWHLATGKSTPAPDHTLGDTNRVTFSPDGAWLAGGGTQGVSLWNVRPGPEADSAPQLQTSASWAANCRDLVFESDRGLIWNDQREQGTTRETVLWRCDLDTRSPWQIAGPRMHQGWHGLAFDRARGQVTIVAADRHGESWDLSNRRRVRSFGAPQEFQSPHIALSADGQLLAGLRKANEVAIWSFDDAGERKLFSLRPEPNSIYALAWSPDGELLALGLADGGISVWNIAAVRARLATLDLAW